MSKKKNRELKWDEDVMSYDNVYLQIEVKADNIKNSTTIYKSEDNMVGVTWHELANSFYKVLQGMGYTFTDDMDEKWEDLINSGMKTIV